MAGKETFGKPFTLSFYPRLDQLTQNATLSQLLVPTKIFP